MYEEAFELGERSFDDQFKKNPKKLKPKQLAEPGKVPSLLKGDDVNRSTLKSGKLKPLDDKIKNSRMVEKQSFIQASSGNVNTVLFRWSGSMTSRKNSSSKLNDLLEARKD